MAHYAELDENNVVLRVLVIERAELETGAWGDPSRWVQTSYNTYGGVHFDPTTGEPSADQSKALRKNYAGTGYIYDPIRDAFIGPQPFPSWALDENSCQWVPPVPYPDDELPYIWDEATVSWKQIRHVEPYPSTTL
jgi:hypothetical protein